ncbi:MAG: hypothetical protein PHS45_02590 [Bacilli bacterium]|nr:hypothetical protein [Bacilli bacterium]
MGGCWLMISVIDEGILENVKALIMRDRKKFYVKLYRSLSMGKNAVRINERVRKQSKIFKYKRHNGSNERNVS